jgi:hypothetical protein
MNQRRKLRKKLKNGTKHTRVVTKTLWYEERDGGMKKIRGLSEREFFQGKNSANNFTSRKSINIKFK